MILISEIKIFKTDLNPMQIAQQLSSNYEPMRTDYIPPEITTEMVRGRRYVNYKGEEVCIGMSKQVQDAIGLPFEVFDNMRETINFLESRCQNVEGENFYLLKRLERHNSINFWGRFKYLLTGKVEDTCQK